MNNNDEMLRKYLGIGLEDINKDKLIELVVDAFIYHEGMSDISLNALNSKTADESAMPLLWESFETNNAIAFAIRGYLLKSSDTAHTSDFF